MLIDLVDLFPRIVRAAPEYVSDPQFVQGVIVELTGSVIEIAVLSLLLPLAWHTWTRLLSRGPRSIVQSRFMHVFSRLADIALDLGSLGRIQDQMPFLLKEYDKNPRSNFARHGFNGGLSQKLLVIRDGLLSDIPAYRRLIEQRSRNDLQRYRSECRAIREDLHHLAAMVNHFPHLQSQILLVYTLVGGLLELLEMVLRDLSKSGVNQFNSGRLVNCVEHIVQFIHRDHKPRERLIESVRNWQDFRGLLPLILRLPVILTYRFIGIRWAMLRGRKYNDPWAERSVIDVLPEWKERNGYSDTKAAAELGIAVGNYQDYVYGYKRPSTETYVSISNRVYADMRRWRTKGE